MKSVFSTVDNLKNTREEAIPCENCISREDALMTLTGEWNCSKDELISTVAKRMNNLPPVQPKIKTGHWIVNKEKSLARCSNCKFLLKDKDEIKLFDTFIQGYNYCPSCGARMIEPQESEASND